MSENNSAALPCPFCGELPHTSEWENEGQIYSAVACETEGCYMDCRGVINGEKGPLTELLKKWNSRKP